MSNEGLKEERWRDIFKDMILSFCFAILILGVIAIVLHELGFRS